MTTTQESTAGTRLRLDGRVAVVTGASRGLGRAIAHRLAASGCDVLLNYASSQAAAEATLEALAGLPGRASALRGDVRDPAALRELLDAAGERYGGLDVFVHNAAVWEPMPAVGADLAAFHRAQSLALDPLLLAAPDLAQRMAPGGRVVVISSNGAGRVIPGYVGVGVSKAAVESLVRYLAVELAPCGIAVNAIATAMLDKGEDSPYGPPPELVRMLAGRTPAGRLSTPDDVAAAVALLCADEAGWIHGQVITADGGLGLRA